MASLSQAEPESTSLVKHGGEDGLALVPSVEQQRFMPALTLELAVHRRKTIVDATTQLMQEGVDYGKIPGVGDRPSLLQPGADKLCNLFGLVVQYEIIAEVEDWSGDAHDGEPFFYYKVRSRAFRSDFLMGEGIGSCNSWESKYRWRKAERKCPNCGRENIRRSKQGDGWYCWQKTGGCGATYPVGSPAIESQEVGRVLNPDIFDIVNTVQKMAFKRAKIAATINATSASEFFTQDLEDRPAPAQETYEQLVARRMTEERAKVAPPVPAPGVSPAFREGNGAGTGSPAMARVNGSTPVPPVPITAPSEVPDGIQDLRRRMNSRDGIIRTCEDLRQQLIAAQGPEAGEASYWRILGRHGMGDPGQFRGKYSQAWRVGEALWEEIQSTRRLPQAAVAAIDEMEEEVA